MADGGRPKSRRFSAFVSYSSEDVAFTRRLHRRLETYRLPRKLRTLRADSPTPERLKPLFRDVDELTAFYDLTAAVRDALAQSDFLIVVCSPNAVQSEWVGREIEYFRELRGDDHILAVLIDGTPATAFHPALLKVADGRTLEPLAADFRPESGSRRLAMLKLVAALAGVELDQLVHRDAQRQQRRTLAVAAGSMAAVMVVGVLAVLTLNARAETDRKRQQAGGLVDHMLTDVRKNLQRTGRLDQLAAVNESAMAYYRGQDLARLTDDELRQRAKLLQAMGEDDEKRGNLDKARKAFIEAHRTTAKLLAAKPNDTERIFAHAQSEYWVGFINWRNGDGAAARRGFEAYAKLAQRLVELEPGKASNRSEVGYASSNLGLLAMRQTGDLERAKGHFNDAVSSFAEVSRITGRAIDAELNLAEAFAWLGECERAARHYKAARTARYRQHEILVRASQADPSNTQISLDLVSNAFAVARLEVGEGQDEKARTSLIEVARHLKEIATMDPSNIRIQQQMMAIDILPYSGQFHNSPDLRFDIPVPETVSNQCTLILTARKDPELSELCLSVGIRNAFLKRDVKSASKLMDELGQMSGSDFYTKRWGFNFKTEIQQYRKMLGANYHEG